MSEKTNVNVKLFEPTLDIMKVFSLFQHATLATFLKNFVICYNTIFLNQFLFLDYCFFDFNIDAVCGI